MRQHNYIFNLKNFVGVKNIYDLHYTLLLERYFNKIIETNSTS